MSEQENNETMARELSAKRITREGLKRDFERFERLVSQEDSPRPPGRSNGDPEQDGRGMRWWWPR